MEKESINVFQELNNMQSKITSLFQGLIKERNEYKQNSEYLGENLIDVLGETENLKKQNEILRKSNADMRNIISKGIRIFKNLDFSDANLVKDQKLALEILKKIFLESHEKLENAASTETIPRVKVNLISEKKEENAEGDVTKCKLSEEDSRKEFGSFSNLDFSGQFFSDDEDNKKRRFELNKNSSETALRNFSDKKSKTTNGIIRKPNESDLLDECLDSELLNTAGRSGLEPALEERIDRLNKSPVFKDFGGRRQEESDGNSSKSSPFKLVSERSASFLISPWKKHQFNESSPSIGSLTPKRTRKKLKIISPKRSPTAQLKKSYSREAEISISGVRKLTQTILNIDCYKRKSPTRGENLEDRENEDCENRKDSINVKEETKTAAVIEDDDIIIESPKKSDQVLEDIKNKKKNGQELNDDPFITPPRTSDLDLDETYISSSIVRKCQLTKKHVLERIIEDQTPPKRQAKEKSPEYDSVPFPYKRGPVRKKAERMKLPGHACVECNKYYENALGNVDIHDMKKILNKCSRHRDKNSPTLDDTPPGYWKPYLTCSSLISPGKDNVS